MIRELVNRIFFDDKKYSEFFGLSGVEGGEFPAEHEVEELPEEGIRFQENEKALHLFGLGNEVGVDGFQVEEGEVPGPDLLRRLAAADEALSA